MSDIGKDIRTYLQTVSDVTDIIGTRMFPRMLPQGEALPAIIFNVIGSRSVAHMGGAAGSARAMLQLDCYAETHLTANNLGETVRQALHGYIGTAGGRPVGSSLLENKREMYETPTDGSDLPAYRVMMEWEIWHEETVPSF